MYRAFEFEGDVHRTLECVPLAVRRKLDLAALKIPLDGWQALTRAERLALCHLPVDTAGELEAYREVLRDFARARDVPLTPILARPDLWRGERPPEGVRARLAELPHRLTDEAWRALADEERFAIVKLAEPARAPWKLPTLLAELGLAGQGSDGLGAFS